MIIDFRYHIASLVAVFLALGIGILVGSALLGNDVMDEQQERLIDSLQKEFTVLREQNREAAAQLLVFQEENGVYEEFSNQVFPLLVAKRLNGKRVAVVETNKPAAHGELTAALHLAGAEVTSFTSVIGDLAEPALFEQMVAYLQENHQVTAAGTADIARQIAKALITGEGVDFVGYLESLELLKVSGQYGVPVDIVIVIGGGMDKESDPKVFDVPLIRYLQNQKVFVAGVEDSDVLVSFMEAYQVQGITTVDNIDTVPGQTALILALEGRPGNYGTKPSAKRLLPRLDD